MGHFFGPFSPYLGKTGFSSRFCSYQFFLILTKYHCVKFKKKTKKLMSAFQATLISVPLKPIVHNGDNQKKRENPFPAKPTSQKFCPLFHNYQPLRNQLPACPLVREGLEVELDPSHISTIFFNQQIYAWYILHPLFFDNFLPLMGYPNPMKFENIWIIKQQLPQYNGSFLNFQQLKDRYEHALSSNYHEKKNTKSTRYLAMLSLQPPMLIILIIITIIILQISIT